MYTPEESFLVGKSLPCAFVLSLNSSTRNKNLFKQCEAVGIRAELFRGVDLRTSRTNEHDTHRALRLKWLERDMTSGEMGCSVSHRKILEEIKERDLDAAYVFEDDAEVLLDLPNSYHALYDFISGESKPVIVSLFRENFSVERFRKYKIKRIKHDIKLIKPARPTYGTVGYLVNRQAVDLILQSNQLLISPADWPIEWIGKINFMTVVDRLVTHDDQNSSLIEEERRIQQEKAVYQIQKSRNAFVAMARLIIAFRRTAREIDSDSSSIILKYKMIEIMQYRSPTLFRILFRQVHSSKNLPRKSSIYKIVRLPSFLYWKLFRPFFGSIKEYLVAPPRRWIKKSLATFNFKLVRVKINNEEHGERFPTETPSTYLGGLAEVITLGQTDFKYSNESTFALVVTIFNQSEVELNRCLRGIQSQKRIPDEIVWLDGGSTNPQTLSWLLNLRMSSTSGVISIDNSQHQKFLNIQNIGIVETRNFALKTITSRYVVFHDPDDELKSNFFDEIAKSARLYPASQVIFPNVIVRNFKQKEINYWVTGPTDVLSLLKQNQIPSTSCIDREFLIAIGGYRVEMEKGMEDWDLWVRASIAKANFTHSPRAEYFYTENGPESRTILLSHHDVKQKNLILTFAANYLAKLENNS